MTTCQSVLIVDDDASDREQVRLVLLAGGADDVLVREAATGAAGYEGSLRERPDVVLVDFDLADVPAVELLRRLQAAHGAALPVLLLIADSARDDALAALALGAQDYLARSELTPLRLRRAVSNAIARSQWQAQLDAAAHEAREAAESALARAAEARALLETSEARLRSLVEPALSVHREAAGEGGPAVVVDVAERDRVERDLRFLADASSALSGSLDLEATLESLALLVVSRLGDGCAIDLVEDNGVVRRVAVAHADPRKAAVARSMPERWVLDPRAADSAAAMLRTGRALHVPRIDEAYFEAVGLQDEPRAVVVALGLRALLHVPLCGRDRVFGVLTVGLTTPARTFAEHDIALAEELGRRAGQAIENARCYRDARTAIAQRDQVLSVVSHDLRAPLSVIGLQASMLSLRSVKAAQEHWTRGHIDHIHRAASKMNGMLNQLLDVAKLQAGESLELELVPTDLVALVRAVADELQGLIAEHPLDLRCAAPEVVGSWDRKRLEQVICNLLTNAAKYSARGEGVELVVALDGAECASLTVRDRGIGIPCEDLPHVFEWFRRGTNVTGRIRGTGVGLASARFIVEQHGGTIAVESTVGEGTTFVVRLPLTPPRRSSDVPYLLPQA